MHPNVVYDPDTDTWAMYLGDELIGFARTRDEAWHTLLELIDALRGDAEPLPFDAYFD